MAATGDELRQAMRRYPSGVSVVTVDDEGTALGTTIGSLVSLSLEPPLVGISIGHQSSIHLPLRHAGRFAVSVLAGDQAELAKHFARSVPPIAQWAGIERRDGPGQEPLLAGAVAWLACDVASEHEAGDHTVFVGAVGWLELGRPLGGLAYVGGEYRGT
jgi:3-hydroxy-9,10-secoandrosta-1,3,5(10)-triene-9,17-dione monooxygenase reductase component